MLFSVDDVVFFQISELLGKHFLGDFGHETSQLAKTSCLSSRQVPYDYRHPFPGKNFKCDFKFLSVATAADFIGSVLRHIFINPPRLCSAILLRHSFCRSFEIRTTFFKIIFEPVEPL